MEDERIIQLYNQRDEGAVQATREKYGGLCFRIALNLLSVREDAEECVNDVYFAAWRQIPPLLPASLGAFLGRVTRNLAISRYRASTAQKRDRGVGLLLSELEECLPDGNSLDAQVDSPRIGPCSSAGTGTGTASRRSPARPEPPPKPSPSGPSGFGKS